MTPEQKSFYLAARAYTNAKLDQVKLESFERRLRESYKTLIRTEIAQKKRAENAAKERAA